MVFAVAIGMACSAPGCASSKAPGADDAGPDTIDAGPSSVDAGSESSAAGHAGTQTVTGAIQATSPSYKLTGTVGPGDGNAASPTHQHRGGVTGATADP